jgi:hypothetical protein
MTIEPGTSPKHRYELIKATLLVIVGALITITIVYGIPFFSPKDVPDPIKPAVSVPEVNPTPVVENTTIPTTPEAPTEKVYTQEELNTIFEIDKKKAGTKLFYSPTLGVGFTYAPLEEDPKSRVLSIKEKTSKIAIIDQYSGQLGDKVFEYANIEVFTKDPKDNLEQAISKEFLKGVDSKKCFAKKYTDGDSSGKQLEGYIYAEISYAPTPGSDAVINNGIENCPKKVQTYATTNAVQFFLEDPKIPSKYVFLRLGQEAFASSGTGNDLWERSLRILK